MKALFVLLISAVAVGPGWAADDAPLENSEADISGFIIDNTITRAGHDFARHLAEARRLNFADATYDLTVRERPSARWGNLVWVENEGKTVYRQFLQLRAGNVQEVAEGAAAFIHEEVQRVQLRALLADDFDLAKDEF